MECVCPQRPRLYPSSHIFPLTAQQSSHKEHQPRKINLDCMHVEIQKSGLPLKRASTAVVFTPDGDSNSPSWCFRGLARLKNFSWIVLHDTLRPFSIVPFTYNIIFIFRDVFQAAPLQQELVPHRLKSTLFL